MLPSTEQPPNEDPVAPPPPAGEDPPANRGDQLDEVAALLRGEDPEAPAQPAESSQGEDPQTDGKPDTLDAIATKLGVEVSDLYDVAVKQPPGPGGEDRTVTLGELADMAKDSGQLELDRLEFDESRTRREQDLMRAQQELSEIVALIPDSAKSPDLVAAVSRKVATQQTQERALTLKVIPEWTDETVETRERDEIGKHLGAYGFPPNHLEQVIDHRTVKYIRDNWQRERNMAKALEAMKRRKAKATGAAKPAAGAPRKRQASSRRQGPRSVGQQVEAVAELLRTEG